MSLKILALIPARGGSKGVPRKNIRILSGKPMIIHTLEAASISNCFQDIVISTDSKDIQRTVIEYGFRCDELRPARLAQDDTPMQPVVHHALMQAEKDQNWQFDAVCLLQPTSPFRNAEHIAKAIEVFTKKQCDTLVSVTKVPHRFIPSCLMVEDGDYLRGYQNNWISTSRHEDPVLWARNGPAILITRSDVIRKGSLYGKNIVKFEMDIVSSIDIDSEQDWSLTVLLAQVYGKNNVV